MVICGRWSVSSSCLMDTCRFSSITARMALIFSSVICEWGWPVSFARTGTALRSFTNIACHFNTVDLAKHSFPYASFNLKSVSIAVNAIFYLNPLCSRNAHVFHQKNEKKHKFRNQTSICYKMHAIQRRLFVASSNDTYMFLLSAGMVHNSSSAHYTHLGHSYIVE